MTRLLHFKALWRLCVTHLAWRWRLGALGPRSILYRPMLVSGARRISIGSRTSIRDGARLEVLDRPDAAWTPLMKIGDSVNIEQGVHIVCQCEVTIGSNVSITPYCVIVDTFHPNDPPDTLPKIGARLPSRRTHVRIGEGTFIGAHSVILPDVTIGRGCVIGAGSVVTHDLPDYCVATGSPARVIKLFDLKDRLWKKL